MSTPDISRAAGAFAPPPETFFKAQARNRRATWRMTAVSAFAAFVMGIPLTLVLTPLLYALTLIAAEVVNHFSPLPPEFWQTAQGLSSLGVRLADYVLNQRGVMNPQELALGLALLLIPGMALAFFLWMGMLVMFRRGGVGGALASLNAREPNQGDFKELQLADVVQEMSIAAGITAPRVMLLDAAGANAAVIGSSQGDARIVLSRRLLDDLNRDQLQAVLGNLIASIGNGDLRIAFAVTSVFETCGLIVNLINFPFGKQSRARIWKIVRYLLSRGTPEQKAALAAEIAESLAISLDSNNNEDDAGAFLGGNKRDMGFFQKIVGYACFPLVFTNLGVELTLWIFTNVLLGPCMALLWRTRQYLADASAVELTRNPDAMASALQRLSEDRNTVEGGAWASHLFLVNPKGDVSMRGMPMTNDQEQLVMRAWMGTANVTAGAPDASTASPAQSAGPGDYMTVRADMMATAKRAATGDVDAIARLEAVARIMGGNPALGLQDMPNPSDIAAAMRGDADARARIAKLRQARTGSAPKQSQSGLQMASMISFHPPLSRRVKRLQKMGSHIIAPGGYGMGTRIALTILWLIIGPLLAVAGVMVLLVIGIMIGFNLAFLTLWLTAIHWIFTWWNGS